MGLYCRGQSSDYHEASDYLEDDPKYNQVFEIDHSAITRRLHDANVSDVFDSRLYSNVDNRDRFGIEYSRQLSPVLSNQSNGSNSTNHVSNNFNKNQNDDSEEHGGGCSIDSESRRRLSYWDEVGSQIAYPGNHIGVIRPNSDCSQELLEDEFVVIWRSLNGSMNPTRILVWADEVNREIKFSIINDAVVRDLINWKDRAFFAVAVFINLLCSTVASIVLSKLFWDTCVLIFGKQFEQDININSVASHRLDHEISSMLSQMSESQIHQTSQSPKLISFLSESSGGGWNINVTSINVPFCGFSVRWAYTAMGFARIGVQVRPIKDCDETPRKRDFDAVVSLWGGCMIRVCGAGV